MGTCIRLDMEGATGGEFDWPSLKRQVPTGPDINTAKKYRLVFGVELPAHCQGLKKSMLSLTDPTSWRQPFGLSV